MLTQAKRCLNDYQEKYRRPDLPALELSGIYALFPEEGLADFVESGWNDAYPNSEREGVYLIFGKTGMLLCIGKASMGASLGGRLGTYFAGKKECRLVSTDWTERPTYVATIAVPRGMGFEAPALEEYLVRSLKPCNNNLGILGQVSADDGRRLEASAPGAEAKRPEPASPAVAPAPGVYTYSASGMPMCPVCGQRPTIFYCSTHQAAACLECVAKHDVPGECNYVPAFRARRAAEGRATPSEPHKPPSGSAPGSILGIG